MMVRIKGNGKKEKGGFFLQFRQKNCESSKRLYRPICQQIVFKK